jgi:hypothetical protein
MSSLSSYLKRDLFEIENARNLSRDELVDTFVPTKAFWRLLSAKNHIVLGARGSGKTALAKMLSHDHLSRYKNERARKAIASKEFIGIYVPTSIEWVSGLKNKPWQTEREAEEFFQWRLNISTCLAFLITLRSCLESYIPDIGERAFIESQISLAISESWSVDDTRCNTIRALQNYLEDVEHKKQLQLAHNRSHKEHKVDEVGILFNSDLFYPLRRAIILTKRHLEFPENCTWMVCLDETEFLSTMHHRIINSYLRSDSGFLKFKMTTMPYCHYTLETNAKVPLNVGHDFEYVYIDRDPVFLAGSAGEEGQTFATTLFNKRLSISRKKYGTINLKQLLGQSDLLDRKIAPLEDKIDGMMDFIEKYASPETISRARSLNKEKGRFSDQISRKMHGAILLRDAVEKTKGRGLLDIYSGYSMAIRCGDGNPRRLIRLFNSLLLEMPSTEVVADKIRRENYPILDKKSQNRVFTAFSSTIISRVQSEPENGPEVHKLVMDLGNYMKIVLHEMPLTTDQLSSVEIDEQVTDKQWQLIETAVGLGLLFPNVNQNNPDQMPFKNGTFHLAYVLAPFFKILPRRGSSTKLTGLIKNYRLVKKQKRLKDVIQLPLDFTSEEL